MVIIRFPRESNPTLDNYIRALQARDCGAPYSKVLSSYGINPYQFYRFVSKGLDDAIKRCSPFDIHWLTELKADENSMRELWRMDEPYLAQQYRDVSSGVQSRFFPGSFQHPANVRFLAYHALSSDMPALVLPEKMLERQHTPDYIKRLRDRVLCEIQSWNFDLKKHFYELHLAGLMTKGLPKGKVDSPLSVVELYDEVYQERAGDASLFDLAQEAHLHRWSDPFEAPKRYWRKPVNVRNAIYHILGEDRSALASTNRMTVLQGIVSLPSNLESYLHELGMASLMMNGFKKGEMNSPIAVVRAFDKAYQIRTNDRSLFDETQNCYVVVNVVKRPGIKGMKRYDLRLVTKAAA